MAWGSCPGIGQVGYLGDISAVRQLQSEIRVRWEIWVAERGTWVGDSKFLHILDNGILLGARGQMADVCHLCLRLAYESDD